MSNSYRLVQWNRHKKVYDLVATFSVVVFLAAYAGLTLALSPSGEFPSPPILAMRGLGFAAILLLHTILAIGPLARLSPRFAPMLYNRRHLGVLFFLLALLHFLIALGFYGGFGVTNPFSALLSGAWRSGDRLGVPFELLGFLALLVFFVMAATSHDFWLHALGPRVWKSLHMLVYPAYALVVLHVALGVMQGEASPWVAVPLTLGVAGLSALHITAGVRQRALDARTSLSADWIDAGPLADIPDSRAKVLRVEGAGEIAVFRDGDAARALSNRCIHQGGPLGEGQIIGGCVTCPWHGYQFDAATGCSPPPFTDRVRTYAVRIEAGRVLVNPNPMTEGSHDD